jgi:WD40 repeat protein
MTTNVPGTDPLVLCTTVWDTTTHQPITAVAGHPFKFAPDSTLATKLSDSTLALWQIQATGAVERLRLAAESKLSDSDSFAFSRDSSFLAARGPNQIVIWPLQMSPVSPKTIRRDGLGNQGGLLFSADGQTLIVAVDSEGLLECWDFRSMRRVGEMRDGRRIRVSGSVEALALSSDGRALATAGPSGVVQLWDLSSRTKLREFRHRGSGVGPMAFSPDGKTLVGGTIDGRLHFWNVASGSEIAALAAHVSSCRSISFSPDGRCLATAEVADMIKVWPAPDFEETDGPFSLPDKR